MTSPAGPATTRSRPVRLAPDFRVRLGGAELPPGVRSTVRSIRYEDGVNAADRVELELANPDLRWLGRHIRGLGFAPFPTAVRIGSVRAAAAPAGTFDLDNRLELALGYAGERLEPMFDGDVTGLTADFPADGMPTLTVVAHDRLHRLTRGTAMRGFGLLPDFVIASILAAENQLLPLIDPAVVGASSALAAVQGIFRGSGRTQLNTTDFALLAEVAASYDATFWVDGDVLHLERIPHQLTPALELDWGGSLLELTPRVTTVGQVAAVSARLSLREIPLDFVLTVGWDFDRATLDVTVRPGVAAGATASGPAVIVLDRALTAPGDIPAIALEVVRELRDRLNARLTASGSAVGNPLIRAGALVRLSGLGPDFSGDYRVVSAAHSLTGSGYRTTFDVRREIIP